MSFIRKLLRNESGATAIEYGLIVALLAIGIISALQGMGDQLNTMFNTTSSGLADT
jgi:pilus assembly protein Flp/PilA